MSVSENKLPLGERLRKVAADDRALAQRANEYFHRYQESAGWYNAVIKGEYQDRSDYAPTLERCALLEEAANALDGVKQSEDAVRQRGMLVCAKCNDYHDEDSVCSVCHETALAIQKGQPKWRRCSVQHCPGTSDGEIHVKHGGVDLWIPLCDEHRTEQALPDTP